MKQYKIDFVVDGVCNPHGTYVTADSIHSALVIADNRIRAILHGVVTSIEIISASLVHSR